MPQSLASAPALPVGLIVFVVVLIYALGVALAVWLHVRATRRVRDAQAALHPVRHAEVLRGAEPRSTHQSRGADASRYPELASHRDPAGRSAAR